MSSAKVKRLGPLKLGVKLLGVVALTALLAWLGLSTGRSVGGAPAMWWANAALVSVILLSGRRNWLPLLAAGFAGNVAGHLVFGDPIGETLALSACETVETAIAVFGVGVVIDRPVDLGVHWQLIRFVSFAVLLGPLVASYAAGQVLHLALGTPLTLPLRWFPASTLGMSIVVPLVLGLARRETRELFHLNRLMGTLLYLLMIAVVATAMFSTAELPWLFLIFPPLLFLVVRLGLGGGLLGCGVVAAIGVRYTFSMHDGLLAQLADPTLEHRLLILQIFLAAAVLSVSVVGIVYGDLQRVNVSALKSEERYRDLARSMEALAAEDPLTGVANRRLFDRTMLREWHRAKRSGSHVSLLLVDVDRFKAFNELYGQLPGDNCLRSVAGIAAENSRRASDLVARFGGDEFAVILPETPAAGALEIAERLRSNVARSAMGHAGNLAGVVTVSVGCATMMPSKGAGASDLITAAEAALYGAKQGGRNRVEAAS